MTPEFVAGQIAAECDEIKQMLLDKNRRYGNSALDPVRLFSSADPIEQINVRLDDKLSRIRSGQADDNEDPELDLIGYLILKRIKRQAMQPTDSAPAASSNPVTREEGNFVLRGNDTHAVLFLLGIPVGRIIAASADSVITHENAYKATINVASEPWDCEEWVRGKNWRQSVNLAIDDLWEMRHQVYQSRWAAS